MAGEDDAPLAVLREEARRLRVPEQGVPHMDLVRERLDVVQHFLLVRERVARDLDQLRQHVDHLAFHRDPDLISDGRTRADNAPGTPELT